MTLKRASKLKARVARGESISALSLEVDVPYQTLYRLSKGLTWPEATPEGDVLEGRTPCRGAPRKFPLDRQHAMWDRKRKGIAISKLAQATRSSESTVRRLCTEFEAMLAHRISRLHLTSGAHTLACQRYGISSDEAEALDALANEKRLSPRAIAFVEASFSELEKQLKSGGGK